MTVGELLARVSSRELSEWMAYGQLEPFGDERADLRSAIVAAVVANANRDPKRRRRPFKPRDFMPEFVPRVEAERGKQTWEQQLQIVEMFNIAFGGRDLRGRD